MEKSEEIWKKLSFLENGQKYSVSNMGYVRNDVTGRILKHAFNKKIGYYYIALCQNSKCKWYYIHRIIGQAFLENPRDLPTVDHIDRDRGNNNLSNLRWASQSEQNTNQSKQKNTSSKYIGVSWTKANAKWCAKLSIEGKQKHVGYFDNEEDAARAYDAACHSEFHTKNFP
jgi:hypothetical protein